MEAEAKAEEPKAFEEHGKNGEKTVVCPNCGRENPAEEPNCLYCSARLYNVGTAIPPFPNMPYGARVIEISPDDTIGSHKFQMLLRISETAQADIYLNFMPLKRRVENSLSTGRRFSSRPIGSFSEK